VLVTGHGRQRSVARWASSRCLRYLPKDLPPKSTVHDYRTRSAAPPRPSRRLRPTENRPRYNPVFWLTAAVLAASLIFGV